MVIENIFKHFKWHWSLEKISESFEADRWCVFDTDELTTLSDESTAEEAIRKAIISPLTEAQQRYSVKYLWDWQRKIIELQSTIARQQDLINRLVEDGERLAETNSYHDVDTEFSVCIHCG